MGGLGITYCYFLDNIHKMKNFIPGKDFGAKIVDKRTNIAENPSFSSRLC